ncbi:MAG: hypothetical protein QOJ40_2250 [Verrucomicrobiota bacterium]
MGCGLCCGWTPAKNRTEYLAELRKLNPSTYVLEGTTNLGSSGSWLSVATNTLGTNSSWQFNDEQATNFQHRFYRLKLEQ